MENIKIHYETAKGLENISLTQVPQNEKDSINSYLYNFDYILRGEIDGWPTKDFSIPEYQLAELRRDIDAA